MSDVKANIVSSKKDAAYAAKVNQQMASICPELASKYAQYPLEGYSSWLNFEDETDGKPAFLAASQDGGLKEHNVWCMKGKGYYHLLTKVSYVNLYNRVGNSPPRRLLRWQEGRNGSVGNYENVLVQSQSCSSSK